MKPGYKQTEVGVIPEDWEVRRLGDVASLKSGESITASDIDDSSEFPCYGGNGLRGYTERYTHDGAYVLIGRQGALCGNVVRADGRFYASEHAVVVTPLPEIDVDWLAFVLTEMGLNLNRYSESSAEPGLSVQKLLQLAVATPSDCAEQTAIAEALGDVDEWIVALENVIEKKRLVKQGAMQELLTGKRRLPGFDGEWEERRLGEVGCFYKGRGVNKSQSMSGNIPCIRYGELYTKHNDHIRFIFSWISEEVSKSATVLKRGDILFAGSGETKEEIGKCAAYLFDYDGYAGGDIIVFRPSNASSEFLGYYLNCPRIASQKSSMGQGDAVVHISWKSLQRIIISLPPLPEQTAIATILSDMDAEIEVLEAKLAKARQIKRGMMQALLTGRVRLQVRGSSGSAELQLGKSMP